MAKAFESGLIISKVSCWDLLRVEKISTNLFSDLIYITIYYVLALLLSLVG